MSESGGRLVLVNVLEKHRLRKMSVDPENTPQNSIIVKERMPDGPPPPHFEYLELFLGV